MAKQTKERQRRNNSHVHQITCTPITFAEVLSKITIAPDTPSGLLGDWDEKYKPTALVALSHKMWAPNPHMESYQKRRAQKKHERELGA